MSPILLMLAGCVPAPARMPIAVTPSAVAPQPLPVGAQQQPVPPGPVGAPPQDRPATPPDVSPASAEEPGSVTDARRMAAEDPRDSCPGNEPSGCHWVDLWRRHLGEQLALPADWVAQHVSVESIWMDDRPDWATFTIRWVVTMDWVSLPIEEGVRVRSGPGATFESDASVLQSFADQRATSGFHVGELRAFRGVVSREAVVAALATCHGASPPSDVQPWLAEPKKLTVRGTAPLPGDGYHCWGAVADVETGELLECGEVLCRVD